MQTFSAGDHCPKADAQTDPERELAWLSEYVQDLGQFRRKNWLSKPSVFVGE